MSRHASTIQTINPATGANGRAYPVTSDDDVARAIDAADAAFRDWRDVAFADRAALIRKAAQLLRTRSDAFAKLISEEMGKVVREGQAEIEKCAMTCEYYADNAESFLARMPVAIDKRPAFVTFRPLGVVLAVMPWNFPFWQVVRFAAPALMAGNAALLKHASNVPGCALALEQLFADAGFPNGLFRALLIPSSRVSPIIEDRRVAAVTLTGSTEAGRAVAKKAGEMLKKTVLELGGSDAYLILEDADIDAAAVTCAKSRLLNAGQSCIAAKRFIVIESVRERFEEKLIAEMAKVTFGDPLLDTTGIGPLARHDLRDQVHDQVTRSIAAGATLRLGGVIPANAGAFYPPTVLTGVRRGAAAFHEEVFGPVAPIISARDEGEAIAIANDSLFGLGAAVFTKDTARGERIAAEKLEAGVCYVNELVRSDPRLPFGGVKESGYGRELSAFGIREFVNIKSVLVAG